MKKKKKEIYRQSLEEIERVALFLCQRQGEEYSRLPPQDLCPTMGNLRGLYRGGLQSKVYDKEQNSENLASPSYIISEQSGTP